MGHALDLHLTATNTPETYSADTTLKITIYVDVEHQSIISELSDHIIACVLDLRIGYVSHHAYKIWVQQCYGSPVKEESCGV